MSEESKEKGLLVNALQIVGKLAQSLDGAAVVNELILQLRVPQTHVRQIV